MICFTEVPYLVSGLHPLRDPRETELSPRSPNQAYALSAWRSQALPAGAQAILGGMLAFPLRLSGEGILEGEGPGALQEETSCLSCSARAWVPSAPRAREAGKHHVDAVWEHLITSVLHHEAFPFLEFILAN